MRETVLKRYFEGEAVIQDVLHDARDSWQVISAVERNLLVEDMDGLFSLRREHIVGLCRDLIHLLPAPDVVNAIAFALVASDTFEWEDDVLSEVLNHWACPEVNMPLLGETYREHLSWLLDERRPPYRERLPPDSPIGNCISLRRKIPLRTSSQLES